MDGTVDIGADELLGETADATAIPTLSEWGLAFLLIATGWIGLRALRHRETVPG
jgi:hypothetical protein